jgi:ribosomal-protein-alanine N-acetyltransferase
MALAVDDGARRKDAEGCRLLPMDASHLDAVHAIERVSQPIPWSRGMFADCLRAGYSGWVLLKTPPAQRSLQVDAFVISSLAMDEAHLLNVAVAPLARRRGWARLLLRHVLRQAAAAEARRLLLEVRASNRPAIALYADLGFAVLARRRDYYPLPGGGREDALLMACELEATTGGRAR